MTYGKSKRALARLGLVVGVAWLALPAEAQQVNTTYRLVRRITPGATLDEIGDAQQMGFQNYLNQQLVNYASLADVEGDVATHWPLVLQTPQCILQDCLTLGGNMQVKSRTHLRHAFIWRMVYSDQRFYERMSWFWANHFNIDYGKRFLWALMPWFNAKVNRKHTFGSFRTLLHASAGNTPDRAAGMLMYLDNGANICVPPDGDPNENYARELMELHGFGKEPEVHTQQHVDDLAAMLSGWTMAVGGGADFGLFTFDPAAHCEGTYDFFGVTIPADDVNPTEGQLALDAIVDYTRSGVPICPQFIAKKLVRAFLTDAPPVPGSAKEAVIEGAIQDATAAFGADGDLTAMLQAILTEDNIRGVLEVTAASPEPPLYKYMPPWLFLSSLLRASEAVIAPGQIDVLSDELATLGQTPYAYGPPIGYPEEIGVWVQDQPSRWSFAYRLFENNTGTIPGVTVDVPALYAKVGGFDRAQCAQQANKLLAAGNLFPADVEIIQRYANGSPAPNQVIMWKVLGLAALSPGNNLY